MEEKREPCFLVTGAAGQLGSEVVLELSARGRSHYGTARAELDITDETQVRTFFATHPITSCIHCASYTAVDRAEEEEALCRRTNVDATRYLAEACAAHGCDMLYISTDYVFDGEKDGYYEITDEPNPLNVYGRTKLEGERIVQELLPNSSYVVRISWLYGSRGGNFVKTMLKLAQERVSVSVVDDQYGSPTYAVDLASFLCDLVESGKYGCYHATNEGVCSWAEFARCIFKLAEFGTDVRAISSAEFGGQVKRPQNSRLSKRSLIENGFPTLPTWKDAIWRYLKETGVLH